MTELNADSDLTPSQTLAKPGLASLAALGALALTTTMAAHLGSFVVRNEYLQSFDMQGLPYVMPFRFYGMVLGSVIWPALPWLLLLAFLSIATLWRRSWQATRDAFLFLTAALVFYATIDGTMLYALHSYRTHVVGGAPVSATGP